MTRNQLLNYALMLITSVVTPYLVWIILTHYPADAITMISVSLMVVSTVLIIIARVQIGRSFAISAQARELVTHGLYSKIRHPIYVFAHLFLLGIVIGFRRIDWFILWMVFMLLHIQRVRNEERVLEEKFGEKYREYRRSTWF